MTSAARKLPAPEAARITSTWWRHKRVLLHLDVDPKTLRARMNDNPDHIDQPWVNIGSVRRPEYRWLADDVDQWWIEVNRWRVSTEEMEAGACAGVTRMASRAAGNARRRPPPAGSRTRSTTRSPSADDGSLVTHVRRRISGSS